ncbi:acetoacetate--CoA ligase [Zoogloea sp. LCSB751]|uniref:acetoacetate--CoA ligase n=1 Tax=Zoogloea sp. LCSB751 TaxID=1965277 RepID=UPI0009A48195|nr:acetoacetate--CoA ligase [Zoogloea sp. LCSB751]
MDSNHEQPLWRPNEARAAASNMAAFAARARMLSGQLLENHMALHEWSLHSPVQFWRLVWEFCEVIGEQGVRGLISSGSMQDSRWFPDARLNFAENLLRHSDNPQALVFWGEDKIKQSLSRQVLRTEVARFAAALSAAGVEQGDRVAAYLPNVPATLIAMLAASSIGAVFTSASPDFGVQGVVDRFGQTEPKVLLSCDGYWYNGKAIEITGKLAELMPRLPSVSQLVVVPYLAAGAEPDLAGLPRAVSYKTFIAPFLHVTEPRYVRLPFDHPLYVMYSSGTTGVPKCIVHGAGGTLLQHLKEHRLHSDVKDGDRLFYFTTCGWMMWNWLVSGLAVGATLMLYDGNPFVSDGRVLWDYAEAECFTHFGTSAKYIETLAKSSLRPADAYRLSDLRMVMSTGSPLAPASFDFVYESIKKDVLLASISGGTDIVSCFVLGNPTLPVWRGEIQGAGLGLAVEVWDEYGRPVTLEKGELVCRLPFPSMPVGFWNDPDGAKYKSAYFERFPGVWCHGDFCEITEHGGFIIHGRSDATLNPGGVRIGTAEIYRQLETLPEVLEAVVIGQDWPPADPTDVRVVLFVRLADGLVIDDALSARIRQQIRDNASPRHVPACIVQVGEIPRTKSGKVVELAVRNVVHRQPVKNVEALANPEALAQFADRPELAG